MSIDVITKYGLTILCSRLMLASNPYDILTDYSGFLKNERNSKKKLIANGEPGANKKKATRKRIIRVRVAGISQRQSTQGGGAKGVIDIGSQYVFCRHHLM